MRTGKHLHVLLFALSAWLTMAVAALAQSPPPAPYVVIVHRENPNRGASRHFLTDAFLKKTTRWPDGEVIHPVDLVPDAPAREAFSHDVLRRSVAEVKSYWQQIIFSGRDIPPPELPDDEAVVRFVARNRGAVGYVSGTTRLVDVRSITVE